MGNSVICSCKPPEVDKDLALPAGEQAEMDPLDILSILLLTPVWNAKEAAIAETALTELYKKARSHVTLRKGLARNVILLATMHSVCRQSEDHHRLATLGFTICTLLASHLADNVLLEAGQNASRVFEHSKCASVQQSAITALTTFYRIAPRYRARLSRMLEGAHNVPANSVTSQHVLNALKSITVAEHKLPSSWAATLQIVSPGWIEINPRLHRCRAKVKKSDDVESTADSRVLYKVNVGDEFVKEMKKFLVEIELVNMSSIEGIIPWRDQLYEDGILYLARIDSGCSMSERLKNQQYFDPFMAVKAILHILAYCASRNLSHGGVNPQCVYYKDHNTSAARSIADWGVERFSNYLQAHLGKASVTPDMAYLAPETRLRRKVKDESAVDVWSCGAILMRLLEGKDAVVQGALASSWVDGLRPGQNFCMKHHQIAETFLSECLQRKPSMRVSASNALNAKLLTSTFLGNLDAAYLGRRKSQIALPPMTPGEFGSDNGSVLDDPTKLWPTAEELKKFLIKHKVNVKKLGVGKAKSVKNLFWEISNKESSLEFKDGGVYRQVIVVEIKVYANTPYGRKILSEQTQSEFENKLEEGVNRFIVKKVLANETWEAASHRTLASELGLSNEFQKDHMQLRGHRVAEEDREGYGNYPGLLSRYRIHTVSLQIANVSDAEVVAANIGLPDGDPFVTKEQNVLGTERGHFWVWRKTKKQ
eukprot:GEMP01027762.1.p1 GENE.GEMP01027762.1~~GEMP01027762.1.p1  ORF type:complete len:709 (+),score=133.20 GEMP01027762.1:147-2273(+)